MIALLNRIDRALARCEYGVLVALMAALTLIMVAQVVCRYFFASPLFWAEDVSVQILTLATCTGTSYLVYRNEMLKVDFLLSILPAPAVALLHRAVYLLGLLTVAFLAFHAAEWLMRPENAWVVSPTTGLPKWYNYFGIAAGFFQTAFHLLVKLLSPEACPADVFAEEKSC